MFIFSIIFILIFLVAIMASENQVFNKVDYIYIKYLFYSFTILLILLVGLRSIGVGADDYNYLYMYERARQGFFHKDISFTLLSRLFPNLNLLFLFFAIVSISLKSSFIIFKQKFIPLSFLIYYSSLYFLHDFVQIRAAIASGLLLWIIYFAAKRSFLKFSIFSAIAISFHISSLIFIPIVFLRNRGSRTWFILLGVFSIIVVFFIPISVDSFTLFLPEFILSRLAIFLNKTGFKVNLLNPIAIIHYFLGIIVLLKWKDINEHSDYSLLYAKIFLIGVYILLIFNRIPGIGFRLYELLMITQIPLIDILVQKVKPKSTIILMALVLSILYFYYYVIKYPVVNGYTIFLLEA